MHPELKIFTDRLQEGKEEKISLSAPPYFLQVQEAELKFDSPVEIKGKAYLADDSFILEVEAKTEAKMPCSICNKIISISLHAKDVYHSIFLEELPESIFDYSELVREDLLLELPPFAECNNGNCSERKNLNNFLKKEASPKKKLSDETHFPFADL